MSYPSLILNLATHKQELKDLEFNFIELPKFDKTEDQLATMHETEGEENGRAKPEDLK